MPKTNDQYTVSLKPSHLDWGRHRYTHTRNRIAGEGYVPIPKRCATGYGINIGTCYTATFADGFPSFTTGRMINGALGDRKIIVVTSQVGSSHLHRRGGMAAGGTAPAAPHNFRQGLCTAPDRRKAFS